MHSGLEVKGLKNKDGPKMAYERTFNNYTVHRQYISLFLDSFNINNTLRGYCFQLEINNKIKS